MKKSSFETMFCAVLLMTAAASAELLYSQPFNNGDRKLEQSLVDYGWTSVAELDGRLRKDLKEPEVIAVGRAGGSEAPAVRKNSMQPEAMPEPLPGWGYGYYAPARNQRVFEPDTAMLFFASKLPLSLSLDQLQKLRVELRSDNTDSVIRFAVKVDSRWYVSSKDYGGSYAHWTAKQMVSDRFQDPGNWLQMDVHWGDGGSMPVRRAPKEPLSGVIEACGIYVKSGMQGGDGPGDHVRFDNFQIHGKNAQINVHPATPKKSGPAPTSDKIPETLGLITT